MIQRIVIWGTPVLVLACSLFCGLVLKDGLAAAAAGFWCLAEMKLSIAAHHRSQSEG